MKRYSPEGSLINSRENRHIITSEERLKKAITDKIFLEETVDYCDSQHNLHLKLGDIDAIIPREECAAELFEGQIKDIAIITRVNKPVQFTVTDIAVINGKKTAFLSRKKVQEEFIHNRLPYISAGDIIDARVTHLENFGAFCDIGCGINALLPIDNISVSRIPHPRVRFSTGDAIKAVVKSFDEKGRITLSHKELLGSWLENAEAYSPGETVSGVIRSIENYGIFVELTPNLSGLAEYVPNVYEGQYASVFIKSILPEKMKIKLIIIDSFDADYPKVPPRYFINKNHIEEFTYSPPNCQKTVSTTF